MPNIKSAKKRVLVNEKKNLINRSILSEVKHAVKKFNNAIDTNRIEDAEKLLPLTMAVIDSAASKGVLHKNNAANRKSRLSKRLSDVKSGSIVIAVKKDNKTIAAEKAMAAKEAREAVKVENARKTAERAAARAAENEAAKDAAKKDKKGGAKTVKKAAKEKEEKKEEKKETAVKEKPVKAAKEKAVKAVKEEKSEKPEKKEPAKKKTKKEE